MVMIDRRDSDVVYDKVVHEVGCSEVKMIMCMQQHIDMTQPKACNHDPLDKGDADLNFENSHPMLDGIVEVEK